MEAKDTVMSVAKYNQVSRAWHIGNNVMELYNDIDFLNRHDIHLLETQAEISFTAGREQAFKEMLGLPEDMKVYKSENILDEKSYLAGKQEGRREVVEELRLRGDMSMNFPFGNIRKEAWQVYLKELGIEESQELSTSPKE